MTTNTKRAVRPRRSFIFSPGLKPDMFPKALASGADIVCVELEDGIAPKDKDEARRNGLALFANPQADDGVERILRINCLRTAFGLADLQVILATDTPPPALMLPKVMSPDEVVWLDDILTERGHDIRLHIIIETNAGLESAHDIAQASPRIDALFFGGVDMAAELRCRNTWSPYSMPVRASFTPLPAPATMPSMSRIWTWKIPTAWNVKPTVHGTWVSAAKGPSTPNKSQSSMGFSHPMTPPSPMPKGSCRLSRRRTPVLWSSMAN